MRSFLELLFVASMPVLKFLLISALGVFLALNRIDILGHTARHHLNQIVFYVFGPALVVSNLAQTITFKSFLAMWFMPINILLTFVIGSVLGWLLAKITSAPKHIKGLVVSSCSAGNLGAMPIIIIPAICKQKGSPFGAVDICNQYGLAYASLSMAIGTIYIWLYIYNIVRISSKKEVLNIDVTSGRGIDKQPGGDSVLDLPETTPVDVAEGFPSTHQSVETSIDQLADTKFMVSVEFKIRQSWRNTCKNINLKAVLAPSTIAAGVGFFIGMISPFRRLLFSDDAPLHVVGATAFMIGYVIRLIYQYPMSRILANDNMNSSQRDAAIPSMTLILGANLLKGLRGSEIKLTIVLGIIVVRCILLPLLGVLIVKGAVHAGFVQPHDLLLQFVILLQYALPPALTIGTITQLFGESESECSVIMLWSYAVAPVTFTLWCTFFLWLVSR